MLCAEGYVEAVEKLVSYFLKTNKNMLFENKRALHEAAHAGQIKVIKLLIKHGFNVNERDEEGDTPLFSAHNNGYFVRSKALECLINHGADVNLQNNKGQSCFQRVYDPIGGSKAIKMLLKAGYNILLPSNSNDNDTNELGTPFRHAVRGPCVVFDIMVRYLLKNNDKNMFESILQEQRSHGSLFHIAIGANNNKMFYYLAKLKWNPFLTNSEGLVKHIFIFLFIA